MTLIVHQILPPTESLFIKSFVYASFVEESIRLLFILFIIFRSSENFTLTEGIFSSVLVGLGFAFVENLHYATSYSGNIIFLRTISSVPIHVFLSGIMGYYVSYAYLNCHLVSKVSTVSIRIRNLVFIGMALIIPWLIHGFYDWCLLGQSKLIYLVPLIIILIFMNLEHLQDKGRDIFGKNILRMLKINADDVSILLQQQNYETWVNNRQQKNKTLHFFRAGWRPLPMIISIVLVLVSIGLYVLIEQQSPFVDFVRDLNHSAKIALLVLYPLCAAALIIISVKIEFSFFRTIFSHVPQTALVNVQPPDDEEEMYSFVMDIHPVGVFLPIQENWAKESGLVLEFIDSLDKKNQHKLKKINATIRWSNQFNKSLPLGYICHFKKQPMEFLNFRLRYQLYKLLKVPKTWYKLTKSW